MPTSPISQPDTLIEALKKTLMEYVPDSALRAAIIGGTINRFNESLARDSRRQLEQASEIPDAVAWYGGVKKDDELCSPIQGSASLALTSGALHIRNSNKSM